MKFNRLPRIVILFCIFASPVFSAPGERQESFNVEDYTKIVADYMKGDYRNAALTLSRVPTEMQEPAIEAYRDRVILESHIKAALLLHTEIVLWTGRDESFHIRKARFWMRELDAYRRRPFEKTWFLVLGYFYMRSVDLEAQPTLEAAADIFPKDLEILLALGTCKETAGWMKGDTELLREAEAIYRDILQWAEETPEAMVRMGRVLEILGQEEEALSYLEQGMEACKDPAVCFAALSMAGDLYRQRGKMAKAIELYRAAVKLDPWCQSGVVALSHALHESGDKGGAYEIVYEYFIGGKATAEKDEDDLWWKYSLGHSHRLNSLLAELRKEVRK